MKYILFLLLLFLSTDTKITVLTEYSKNGPLSVTKSLLRGLKLNDIDFNHNPSDSKIGDELIVLSGVNNLRKGISLKKRGKIKKLIAGPNVMNSPNQFNFLFASREVDICLVPSRWIQIAYEQDAPLLKGRVRCWYAGINEEHWVEKNEVKDTILIYWKTELSDFIRKVELILKKHEYKVHVLKYGTYTLQGYKNILDKSIFAVFISRSESQGIALAEAWAMNVPTFVWNPKALTYLGKKYTEVSACPYLTDKTGKDWQTLNELDLLISSFNKEMFAPREWVLNNMTDKKSAGILLNIINSIN